MKTLSKTIKEFRKALPRFPRLTVGLILVVLLGLTACQSQPATTGTHLNIAGATTPQRSAEICAEMFMAVNPGVSISVKGGGSSHGINGATDGTLDIGMAARPFRATELETFPGLTATVIGYDGVAVVVNRFVYANGVTELSLEQIAAMWRGEITNWQEVGGPNLAIVVYDKEEGHGTRDVFYSAVFGDTDADALGSAASLGGNPEILAAVTQEDGAISIVSSGWQTKEVIGVAIVLADGQSVAPTSENVASGLYPISRDLNMVTMGEPEGLVKQFIDFMLSAEGQAVVVESGYSAVAQQ